MRFNGKVAVITAAASGICRAAAGIIVKEGGLVVGIDTDECIKEKKGPTRPIHNQEERKFFLQNLKAVDEVRFFSNDEELEGLVKSYQPDIMIVGSDWKDKSVIGSYWAAKLIFFDRIGDYATTKTIQSIIDRR